MSRRKINRGQQRKQELREKAAQLELERFARSPTEQIAVLDARLGEGQGAVKERAKLQNLIDEPPSTKTKKVKKRKNK